jgi:hypothetical protein
MTREMLLDLLLLQAAREETVPERGHLESELDTLLNAFPGIAAQRNWILARLLEHLVTVVPEAQELIDPDTYVPWIEHENRERWSAWPWLKLYLQHKLKRPVSVINEIDRSTDRILDLLGDPKKEGMWDRRGLVAGHVQSGKTQHYTALAAKAIDAGFKVVVILTGVHESLRQQTQERIEDGIVGKDSRDSWNPVGVRLFQDQYRLQDRPHHSLPDITTLTSIAGDYGATVNGGIDIPLGNTPVILVVKKNGSILRNLLRKLRGPSNNLAFQKNSILFIDDEADHSSVNTANEDEAPKTINRLLRQLLWCCDKVAFVGYTATPYANIFMDDDLGSAPKDERRRIDDHGYDLFPRAFIVGIKVPSNYIGPDAVFGHDGDESVGIPAVSPLPMHVPTDEAEAWLPARHRRDTLVSNNLPSSLREAIKCFVLSIAARTSLGQSTDHCSMLIHVTRFNLVQEQVLKIVQAHGEALGNLLAGGSLTDRNELDGQFQKIWANEFESKFLQFQNHPSQLSDAPVLPPWEDVRSNLVAAFKRLTFALVNSESKQGLDFYENRKTGLVVIAVGGDRLSRGLTLEGLTISYFLRGARAYDTLMQMGRWFGYRPGYAHLCRVYAPKSILADFKTTVLATEELRREFDTMCFLKKTPVDYGLRVREPRGDLLVTAFNKMRRGETVRIHFAQSLISSLEVREADLVSNLEAFDALVSGMNEVHGAPKRVNDEGVESSGASCRMWSEVSWEAILRFLSRYNALTNTCLDRATASGKSLLHSYIEMVQPHGDLDKWTVVVMGSQRGRRSLGIIDPDYRCVGRKRLMDEQQPDQPIAKGRVGFRGVALGQDEAIDLSKTRRDAAIADWNTSGQTASLATLFRRSRSSTKGLLLIYPIIPTTKEAAKRASNEDESFLWDDRPPVIGIAVSLPQSKHDKGCNYVCTPQKIRELFGETAADFDRDEEESQEAVATAPV